MNLAALKPPFVRVICLAVLLLGGRPAIAEPVTATHRILGLFATDREVALRSAVEKLPGLALVSLDFPHAEAVFTYDPAVVFKESKAEKIVERFDALLRGASRSTLGIAPLVAAAREQLAEIEIPVFGLDCKACALAAYESIAKIDGVAAATVNFRESRLAALIDPAKTNRAALEAALKKRGVDLVGGSGK